MRKNQKKSEKDMEARIKELEAEVKGLKEKYLRALADYQNLSRRLESDRKRFEKEVVARVIEEFLEILDDIDKAEVFVKDKGLALVKDKFKKILKKFNVEEIDIKGKVFDPYLAEVVDTVEGEKENVVTEVFLKGYKIGDKVLRPAKVQVSKRKS